MLSKLIQTRTVTELPVHEILFNSYYVSQDTRWCWRRTRLRSCGTARSDVTVCSRYSEAATNRCREQRGCTLDISTPRRKKPLSTTQKMWSLFMAESENNKINRNMLLFNVSDLFLSQSGWVAEDLQGKLWKLLKLSLLPAAKLIESKNWRQNHACVNSEKQKYCKLHVKHLKSATNDDKTWC